MDIKVIDTTDSTNNYLKEHAGELPAPLLLMARYQTGGRGQRGNRWHSDRDANLLCSLLWRPGEIRPAQQFSLSEAVALAVSRTLSDLCGVECKVKWPNDIYAGDKKISGILIENVIAGTHILQTVAGMGINLNQTCFDACLPNPTSVAIETGRETDIPRFAEYLCTRLEEHLALAETPGGRQMLHSMFKQDLWRGTGSHLFRDTATGEVFKASIADIEPEGFMVLQPENDNAGAALPRRTYAFKEVEFILKD